MAERHGHGSEENGKRPSGALGPNTRVTLAVAIVVSTFVFGVGVWVKGLAMKDDEHDKALAEIWRSIEGKLDKRDMQGWVRELQRDPSHVPEAPR